MKTVFPGCRAAMLLAGLAAIGLAASVARAQTPPPNDNFTNALVLASTLSGTTNGSNFGATQETGEPWHAGLRGGASVWFQWTNTSDGIVQFNTAGSVTNSVAWDTVLAVYTGTDLSSLIPVAANDDVNWPSDPTSKVTFNATAGTVYYIGVDGYNYGTGVSQGSIRLNWITYTNGLPTLLAGEFQFTRGAENPYIFSERESLADLSPNPRMTYTPGARLTVTRMQGAAGRVAVGYSVTNDFYEDLLETTIYGTNMFITNIVDGQVFFTNIFVTNIYVMEQAQSMEYGEKVYLAPTFTITNILCVVDDTGDQGCSITITNLGTNADVFCSNDSITNFDGAPTNFFVTNWFCTNWAGTIFTESARPLVDYTPASGMLTFDDSQMSADILVNVSPTSASRRRPIRNAYLIGTLTSVALDAAEFAEIAQPTISPISGRTFINILNQSAIPGMNMLPPKGTNLFNFERATLRCREDVGTAQVYVLRSGDISVATSVPYRIDYRSRPNANNYFRAGGAEIPLQAGSDYAAPENPDAYSATTHFTPVTGTLNWGAYDADPKPIEIPITDDTLVQFNEDLLVQLYFDSPVPTERYLGFVQTCVLTILFDEQPAGAVDRSHNPDNNSGTQPPYMAHPGANNTVYAVAVQTDGKCVIGGDFTSYNSTRRYRVARVNANGQLDTSFDPADGADQFVSTLALEPSGKIIVGGAFTAVNRSPRLGVARLNSNGSLDTTFNPGLGANGLVWAVALQTNGAVLVAGEFTTFNGTNRNYIARLNSNGSLDMTFDPGSGPNDIINAVALQPDGKVLIGGQFTSVAGVSRSHIARLNPDGSLDATFDPASGADDVVHALALQPDGKVLAGGNFTTVRDLPRIRLARFNPDGTLDPGFDVGTGPDDTVYSLTLQPDGYIILGGIFTSINQTRRVAIARLFPEGPVDTSFMDTAYNEFAGLITHYYDPNTEPHNFVYAAALQGDGGVIIGGNFERVGGGFSRDDIRPRSNVARLVGGSTPGPGNIELAYDSYTVDQFNPTTFVTMMRNNGHLGPAAAVVTPVVLPGDTNTPGVAVNNVDFAFEDMQYGNPTWITSWPRPTWHLSDGTYLQNNGGSQTVDPSGLLIYGQNDVYLDIIDNTNKAGDKTVNLQLSKPNATDLFLLGGQHIPLGVALGRSFAPLTILDYHTRPGVLGFSATNYFVMESTNAVITVVRTNGSDGLVTVQYQTIDGVETSYVINGITNLIKGATNGIHYRTNYGRLTFNPGVTSRTIVITNIDDSVIQGDHYLTVRLFNPTAGATLGQSTAWLTIIDNDVPGGYVQFNSPVYTTNENAGFALITVTRNGSSAGTLGVQLATANGPPPNGAVAGVNYSPVTTNLLWVNGDITPKIVAIPLFVDGLVETNVLTFNLGLFAATLNGAPNAQALVGTTNATLFITNTDFRGQIGFSATTYFVNKNGGPAIITAVRTGGSSESIAVNFSTGPGTSVPEVYFQPTNGTLFFNPGEVAKSFTVPIIDNLGPPGFVALILSNASPAGTLGSPSAAMLNIVDTDTYSQPPGSLDTSYNPSAGVNGPVHALALQPLDGRLLVGGNFTNANGLSRRGIARLNTDGSLDQTFSSTSPTDGANDAVFAVASLVNPNSTNDGPIVIGGLFTKVNGLNRNYLARLTLDGSIDTTFNPGAGPNNPVYAIAQTLVGAARKILIGGAFVSVNSMPLNRIARLNDDGSVDAGFNVGLGANGNVFAIAVQPDGKALIGGDFTTFNGIDRNHIARLNVDGSLDLSFNPGVGANESVRAIALQLDGNILIGGIFTSINGVPLNHIGRLTPKGLVDGTFNPGLGLNDLVSTIAIQPDTGIILGGQFTTCDGVTRHRVTRLNSDGSVDARINFGDGADSFVAAAVIQTNSAVVTNGMIIIGGGFTHYDGQPRARIARLNGGAINGSGTFEFTAASYRANEDATNTIVTVRRRGGTSGVISNNVLIPNVSVTFSLSNGTAVAGVNYSNVTRSLVFAPGEVFQTVTVPVVRDFVVTPDLTANLSLFNPLPDVPGGPRLGNQPDAVLTIGNVDGAVSFSLPAYVRNEDAIDGVATIPILRSGSTNGAASVFFATTSNGTAVPGVNYLPVANTVVFAPGQSSNYVLIPLIHNPQAEGDKTVVMELTNASNAVLLNPFVATLTIVDVDRAPGHFLFSATNYTVGENDGSLQVTVLRTGGRSGVVSVDFATLPGGAIPGVHYLTTNGTLAFADGEISKSFSVPILWLTNQVLGNQTFSLLLSNPTGGAVVDEPATVPVTIIEQNIGLTFSSPAYVASETNGSVSLTVHRLNGTNGVTTVQYATTSTNLTALADTNYVAVTNGSLTFSTNETIKSFNIGVLHDPRVTGDLSFGVYLFNQTNAQLYNFSSALVTLLDADPGISFTNPTPGVVVSNASFGVLKSDTNILVTVVRSNANTGTVSVNYATATNANDTAVAGVDYVATGGLLTFSNGITLQTLSVPIINNRLIQGDRTFSINLFNPSPGAQLVPPTTASVTITDNLAGLSFSSPAYSRNENGGSATITVFRSNYTNSVVSVDYAALDGTARSNINYLAVSGTLVFANGETVKTFSVPVIDNGVVDGDTTVLLSLANPVGNAVLVNPSAATLTVLEVDGSLIVPAGNALVSESGPVNGLIDPGETVSLFFGLRNSIGLPTTNLVATLKATNGVTNSSGGLTLGLAPENQYGALVARGPSVSRPFTFVASGTNGQTINATFDLKDGGTNLGQAVFNFRLGTTTSGFTNGAAIVINDETTATPYPSMISVSGLNGVVAKATVTFTNLSHRSPQDIHSLLVSPTGRKSYLMSKSGGFDAVNNVTLTFDDAATNRLPRNQIISGAYRPTAYAPATPQFPVPAPPAPYQTNLAVFNGSDPNGDWSLYVIDDLYMYGGMISNGWNLNLTITGPILASADVGLTMTVLTPTNPPYIATSNLTFKLVVANYGPSTATNIVVTNLLPAGVEYVTNRTTLGSASVDTAGLVTWTNFSLGKDASASLELEVRPFAAGTITNAAAVTIGTPDPNPDDDHAAVEVTVVAPTADLVLLDLAGPPPIRLGDTLTYTITITNRGPATATGVTAVIQLPPSVTFISATNISPANAGYTLAGQVVTFTNLGRLACPENPKKLEIRVRPTVAGTLTTTASCSSGVTDPLKANNSKTIKTVVELVLTVRRDGGSLVISWPTNAGYYLLESTTNLHPPVVWTPVTDVVPKLVGDRWIVTVPTGPGNRFFRLRSSEVPWLPLGVSRAGTSLIFTWPINSWNAKLESATDLRQPVGWTPITSPPAAVVDGQNRLVLSMGSGRKFFRLHGTAP